MKWRGAYLSVWTTFLYISQGPQIQKIKNVNDIVVPFVGLCPILDWKFGKVDFLEELGLTRCRSSYMNGNKYNSFKIKFVFCFGLLIRVCLWHVSSSWRREPKNYDQKHEMLDPQQRKGVKQLRLAFFFWIWPNIILGLSSWHRKRDPQRMKGVKQLWLADQAGDGDPCHRWWWPPTH